MQVLLPFEHIRKTIGIKSESGILNNQKGALFG